MINIPNKFEENSTSKKINSQQVADTFNSENELNHYKNATLNLGLRASEKIIFQKYIKKEDKIIDIGCGSGRTTFGLYKEGHNNITGLDLSSEMIKNAKEIAQEKGIEIPFIVADARHIEALENTYDIAIFSFNGIMMIPEKEKRLEVIKEIKRVLKENGYFIFTTHDREMDKEYEQFWEKEKENRSKGTQDDRLLEFGDIIYLNKDKKMQFIHIPTQEEIKKYLYDTGFSLVETHLRSEITKESAGVETFSKECRFRIVQKNSNY